MKHSVGRSQVHAQKYRSYRMQFGTTLDIVPGERHFLATSSPKKHISEPSINVNNPKQKDISLPPSDQPKNVSPWASNMPKTHFWGLDIYCATGFAKHHSH